MLLPRQVLELRAPGVGRVHRREVDRTDGLGVFDIPLDGLLLAVYFFNAQITKGGNHGGQEQDDRKQRSQRDEAVLTCR